MKIAVDWDLPRGSVAVWKSRGRGFGRVLICCLGVLVSDLR